MSEPPITTNILSVEKILNIKDFDLSTISEDKTKVFIVEFDLILLVFI